MDAWSYSSIKTFESCPKKYFHLRVKKDFREDDNSEVLLYGNRAHKAAEQFVKAGAPLPPEFTFMEPFLVSLRNLPGDKHCELKLGVREDLSPCDFFARDVWWRGVADLLVVRDTLAYSIDYKTGKNSRYADLRQLDLVAGAVFSHFPKVRKIKSALLYINTGELIKKTHTVDLQDTYFNAFDPVLDRLLVASDTGIWNANPSGLCKFCPVTTCEHKRG